MTRKVEMWLFPYIFHLRLSVDGHGTCGHAGLQTQLPEPRPEAANVLSQTSLNCAVGRAEMVFLFLCKQIRGLM